MNLLGIYVKSTSFEDGVSNVAFSTYSKQIISRFKEAINNLKLFKTASLVIE